MRHSVRADRNLDFHSGIINLSQDLGHSSYGLSIAIGVINNLNAHHLTQLGHSLSLGWDQDVMTNTFIFRGYDQNPVLIEKASDNYPISVYQYLHNLAFGATTSISS